MLWYRAWRKVVQTSRRLTWGRPIKVGQEPPWVKAERSGHLEELEDLETPLAALVFRYEGLRPSKTDRQDRLGQAGILASLDQRRTRSMSVPGG